MSTAKIFRIHFSPKFGWEGGLSGKFKPIKFTLQIYMPWTILANNFILRKPLPLSL